MLSLKPYMHIERKVTQHNLNNKSFDMENNQI